MSSKTIASTTKKLICATDAAGIGLSINTILEMIHVEHPGCKTTKSCVSWYLSKAKGGDLKDFAGVLPRERARSTGAANVAATVAAIAPVIEVTEAEKWRDAVNILVNSEYTVPNAVKYITKMADILDIEAVIEADRAAAAAAAEIINAGDSEKLVADMADAAAEHEEFENTELPNEDEAIPLLDERDEELDGITDEELASLVA